MKKIALALLLVAAPAFAGEIALDPTITAPAATKVTIDAFKIDDSSVQVWYAFRAADNTTLSYGNVILRDECSVPSFTNRAECELAGGAWGNDYSFVANFKVDASDVDQKFVVRLEKRIRNRVKQKLNLVGTEVP